MLRAVCCAWIQLPACMCLHGLVAEERTTNRCSPCGMCMPSKIFASLQGTTSTVMQQSGPSMMAEGLGGVQHAAQGQPNLSLMRARMSSQYLRSSTRGKGSGMSYVAVGKPARKEVGCVGRGAHRMMAVRACT